MSTLSSTATRPVLCCARSAHPVCQTASLRQRRAAAGGRSCIQVASAMCRTHKFNQRDLNSVSKHLERSDTCKNRSDAMHTMRKCGCDLTCSLYRADASSRSHATANNNYNLLTCKRACSPPDRRVLLQPPPLALLLSSHTRTHTLTHNGVPCCCEDLQVVQRPVGALLLPTLIFVDPNSTRLCTLLRERSHSIRLLASSCRRTRSLRASLRARSCARQSACAT